MPVIQGSSAYSTKAELIPGIWRGFSAVQLLPVLSAGLGCSFGQGGENGGFFCLFPVAPSLLFPLFSLVSHAPAVSPCCLFPSLLWATVPRLRLSLPLLIWGGFSLAPAGRVSSAAPLALALFPLSLLLSLFSLLRVVAAGRCLSLPCVRCLSSCWPWPSVRLSGRHDLHRLRPLSSVYLSGSGGCLAVYPGQFCMVKLHKNRLANLVII